MFRKDLYYRLNVVSVRLAPLRERRDDIPGLVDFFLEKYGRGQMIDTAALELMMLYDWPGNVRELENAVQQMVALDSGPTLSTAGLPSPLRNFQLGRQFGSASPALGSAPVPSPSQLRLWPESGSPVLPLAEVERRAILQAIEYTRGDRAVAAHLLGIGRTTLYRKLKEYGVADL
jgi:DNA-binding NtrC family response regulator